MTQGSEIDIFGNIFAAGVAAPPPRAAPSLLEPSITKWSFRRPILRRTRWRAFFATRLWPSGSSGKLPIFHFKGNRDKSRLSSAHAFLFPVFNGAARRGGGKRPLPGGAAKPRAHRRGTLRMRRQGCELGRCLELRYCTIRVSVWRFVYRNPNQTQSASLLRLRKNSYGFAREPHRKQELKRNCRAEVQLATSTQHSSYLLRAHFKPARRSGQRRMRSITALRRLAHVSEI